MAQNTTVQLVDDLDGGEANESVAFALDGVEYTIDLSDAHAKKLREGLAAYVESARRADGRKQRGTATRSAVKAGGDKAQNQAIRQWARRQGEKISDRGRISQELVVKFRAAHGS